MPLAAFGIGGPSRAPPMKFSSKVIDDKWPAFEQGFFGLDPNARCARQVEIGENGILQVIAG